MRNKGFTLIELMIVVSIIGILALIAIPNFQTLRSKAYDASAQSAGRSAKLAMEIYYQDHQTDSYNYPSTATALNMLTSYDRNLNDDTNITFTFTYGSKTNYTFTTSNGKSSSAKTFEFND